MCVDQLVDRGLDPGLAQRRDQQIALPGAVAPGLPMLERAAAADAEMRADGSDPLGARCIDPHQMAAVGMTGPRLALDRLARQRVGHVDRSGGPVRDAVAAVAEPHDGETVNHAAPR